MIDEFEILAAHKDFIPGRRNRFFETEELCLRREIEWASATGPPNDDLIGAVANKLARNCKLAGSAERIRSGDLFGRDRVSVYQQLVAELGL